MNRTSLLKATGFIGAAAIAAVSSLPALAQVTPRPATPGLNPRPSIFSEAPYNGSGAPGSTPMAPATAQTTPGRMTASALDREFMIMAAHSDQFEIRSSQLALQKSSNAEVRQYAQQMIQEHTQSTRQLTQLAAQRGVTLPNAPAPFNQAVIQQLSTLSGAEFDRAYLEAQTNGHMQTVAVFRTQVGQGQDAAVKQFAARLLPTIEGHYEVASQMTGQTSAMNMPMPNSMNPVR